MTLDLPTGYRTVGFILNVRAEPRPVVLVRVSLREYVQGEEVPSAVRLLGVVVVAPQELHEAAVDIPPVRTVSGRAWFLGPGSWSTLLPGMGYFGQELVSPTASPPSPHS